MSMTKKNKEIADIIQQLMDGSTDVSNDYKAMYDMVKDIRDAWVKGSDPAETAKYIMKTYRVTKR